MERKLSLISFSSCTATMADRPEYYYKDICLLPNPSYDQVPRGSASLPCGRSVCGHFKPRTVKRRKVWQEIENRLNENRLIHFRVTKRSTREHFSLLLEKFKAKCKNEVKQSGVDVQDSELDVAMEVEKWQEAESQDGTCESKTKQVGE